MPIEFSDDVDPSQRPTITSDVACQRVYVEHVKYREPCFRFWLTADEVLTSDMDLDVCFLLSNANFGVWMKVSEHESMKEMGEMSLYHSIVERKLDDHVV
jgi:hypothetical protein